MSLGSIAVASDELVSTNLNGEIVILGFRSTSYYGLGGVGGFVWDLLQQPRKISEIRDAILQEYDVEPTRCEEDLFALLRELADRQLIEITDRLLPQD
jgi:hypothetical protein